MTKEFLTRSDVARLLHVSIRTVDNWRLADKIQAYRAGRRVLFSTDDVAKMIGHGGGDDVR